MKKILIVLFISFLLFLLFYKRSSLSFEGNNWVADKLIINGKDIIYNSINNPPIQVIYPTQIIVNDWIDSLFVMNPKFEYRYKINIVKDKLNQDIAILKSRNSILNDTLLIKVDTIDNDYNHSRKFIVELKSKKTLIKMSRSISTIPKPFIPRKPVRGLP